MYITAMLVRNSSGEEGVNVYGYKVGSEQDQSQFNGVNALGEWVDQMNLFRKRGELTTLSPGGNLVRAYLDVITRPKDAVWNTVETALGKFSDEVEEDTDNPLRSNIFVDESEVLCLYSTNIGLENTVQRVEIFRDLLYAIKRFEERKEFVN